jgi:hypothetical protein
MRGVGVVAATKPVTLHNLLEDTSTSGADGVDALA